MSTNFKHLGPLLEETRTPAVCEICGSYIFKQIYQDENSKNKQKVVFICKNCIKIKNSK